MCNLLFRLVVFRCLPVESVGCTYVLLFELLFELFETAVELLAITNGVCVELVCFTVCS